LPGKLLLGPRWLIPALEIALVAPLTLTNPYRRAKEAAHVRGLAITLIALVNVANIVSVGLLVHYLLNGGKAEGRSLVFSSVSVWLTNVIVFGLWFWELDRGGPGARGTPHERYPDFQFPQMANSVPGEPMWYPGFVDYLYLGFTNATAFSPTDAMPLSGAAKVLMAIESGTSLITVVVVAARAVNILN
ncbi:MAG: hypothetical protein ACYCZM_05885, partial [Acidimicrobiales bacterium]